MNRKKLFIIIGAIVALLILVLIIILLLRNKLPFIGDNNQTATSTTGALEVTVLPPVKESLNGLTKKQNETYKLDGNENDNDYDGLPDWLEIRLKTDPNKVDTDGDGFSDATEIRNGYDPLQINKKLK